MFKYDICFPLYEESSLLAEEARGHSHTPAYPLLGFENLL